MRGPKKLKGSDLKQYIYDCVISGYSATKICKFTGKNKGYISRIINELVKNGWIVSIGNSKGMKFYRATDKLYNAKNRYDISNSTSVVSQRMDGGCNVLSSHQHNFIIKIKDPPKKKIDVDKEWIANNVVHQIYKYPFCNLNGQEVIFHRILSKKTDQMMFHLPKLLCDPNVDIEKYSREIVAYAAGWYQKRYQCKFEGPIRRNTRIKYGFFPKDPTLVKLAHYGGGSSDNGSLIVDQSPPDNIAEIHSYDKDLLNGLARAPSEINKLKSDFNELQSTTKECIDELQSSIKGWVQQNKEIITTMHQFLSIPSKPDEFIDVV